MNEIILAIISAASALIGSAVSVPYARKRAKAESDKVRAETERTFADGWKELADEQKAQRDELEKKYELRLSKQEKRIMVVMTQNTELRRLLEFSWRCDLLRRNPEAICPVQSALENSKLEKNGTDTTDTGEEADV